MKHVNNDPFMPVSRPEGISHVVSGTPQHDNNNKGEWKKTSVEMQVEQLKQAKTYALMHDISLKQLIHDAIEEYLLNHQ